MEKGSSGSSRFDANILRLQQRLGLFLPGVAYCSSNQFHWEATELGELNLRAEGEEPLHSPQGAMEEAKAQFNALDLNEIHLICCFGIGAGYLYLAAREWLHADPTRYFLLLEDSPELLHRLLESEIGTALVNDLQAHICPLEGRPPWKHQLLPLAEYFNRLPLRLVLFPNYQKRRPELCQELGLALEVVSQSQTMIATQQLALEETIYDNFYKNIAKLEGAIPGRDLYGKFAGVPAIICGAGPSLEKVVPGLRELADRALIIGSGSALTALTNQGFTPHMGSGLCPDPMEGHRFWHQQGYELPLLFRSRIDQSALSYIHGPKIYSNGCEGAQRVAEWIEERLGIEGEAIDSGPSIFTLSCEWARLLGCNPIIFVGLDLALAPGGAGYAPGVLHGSEGLSFSFEEIEVEGVTTYWKWIYESEILSQFIRLHPEVTYLNATGGGIGVQGAEKVDLMSCAERILTRRYDIEGRLHSELKGRPHQEIRQAEIDDLLNELRESFLRSARLIDQILKELRQVESLVLSLSIQSTLDGMARGQTDDLISQPEPWRMNGRFSLLRAELEGELAYRLILEPTLEAKRLYMRRVYDSFLLKGGQKTPLRWQRELSILQENFSFLRQTALGHIKKITY